MSVQCDLLIFSRWFLLFLDRWNERSCEFILVRTYVPPSVRTSVTSFCRKNRFFFFRNFAQRQKSSGRQNWQKRILQKNSFLSLSTQKGPKWSQNKVFLSFHKIQSIIFAEKNLKFKDLTIHCFLLQALYLGKVYFTSFRSKYPCLIRLQNSLVTNTSGTKQSVSQFFSILIATYERQCLIIVYQIISSCWLGVARHAQPSPDLRKPVKG